MIAMVVKIIKPKIAKKLEIEKVNVQGQHPGPAECAAAIE